MHTCTALGGHIYNAIKPREKQYKRNTICGHHLVVKTLKTPVRVVFHSQVEGTHAALVLEWTKQNGWQWSLAYWHDKSFSTQYINWHIGIHILACAIKLALTWSIMHSLETVKSSQLNNEHVKTAADETKRIWRIFQMFTSDRQRTASYLQR